MQKVLTIGEILNEYLLHSNAPLAAAYRKHRTPSQRPDRGRPGTAVSFFRAYMKQEEHIMAKTIITLGREYCTGGRYIAEDVANETALN